MSERWRRASAALAAGAAVVGLLGCGDGTGPVAGDALDQRLRSANYVYLFSSADTAPIDTVWQERWHAWVLDRLELRNPWTIEYRKYRDLAHLNRVTGKDTYGFAETSRRRFHTVWPEDNHEAAHVLWVEMVGASPSFFNEGIAVAFHGDPINGHFQRSIWNGENIHTVARTLLDAGTIARPDQLLETDDFFDLPANVTYPVAGSFVRWLVERHGIARLKTFVRTVDRGDDATETRSRFRAAYGAELDRYWDDWRTFLSAL